MQSGGGGGGEFRISVSIGISFPAGLGLENPNSGPDPGGTFFPNSVSDLGSAGTFPKSRNVGPVIDENVCLLDSQPWLSHTPKFHGLKVYTRSFLLCRSVYLCVYLFLL